MKKSLLLAFALILTCSLALVLRAQSNQSQDNLKVKVKNDATIVRDKSKPVRKAIEDWYSRNMAAFQAKDVAAVMALRTDDFHTITPDGKVNTRADMEARTQRLLGLIDHFISQEFMIGTIEVRGDLASADISQKTVRMQRFPDGSLHKVDSRAIQRETWKKTSAGWKLYRVEDVRDNGLFVDDKPYKSNP
jgi:ketosteroid isomerase-like protein